MDKQTRHALRLTRRGLMRMALHSTYMVALAACRPIQSALGSLGQTRPTSAIAQIVYQDWRTEWFAPMVQEMLAQFHDEHPGIRVYYTPDPEDLEQRMLAEMQAGTAPDVFQGCCTHFPIWAQHRHTLDLRPYVVADLYKALIADWDAAQYRSYFTDDGRQYGLPKYHGSLALFYNKTLFDEVHEPYPSASWTMQDYAEAMRRLSRLPDQTSQGQWGSMIDISWDRIQVYVNAWGGRFVDSRDSHKCRMADAPALEALEWLRARMWDEHCMARPLDVENMSTQQAFVLGRVAMVEDGSWALKNILENAPFRLGVVPIPEGPARRATLATTDGFGIYIRTRYPDAAWELLKFLISKDYGRAMARAHLLQPARASLVNEWVSLVRAAYPRETDEMDLTAFADGQFKGYSVTTEIFANMSDAKRIAYNAWDEILRLGKAPVDRMVDVCHEIEQAQQGQSR
jgi:multiple sugar transport system substrate-binding protein